MTTSHSALLLLAILATLSFASPSVMEEGYEGHEEGYEDEDNALTEKQIQALHDKIDADGDGKVSMEELLWYATEMTGAMAKKDVDMILQEIDLSQDRRLTLEEHLKDIEKQAEGADEEELKDLEMRKVVETAKHAAADRNKDGFLDEDEIPALYYPEVNSEVLSVSVADTLERKDADKDGKLSIREFWIGATEATDQSAEELSDEEVEEFKILDQDKDGFLDTEELREWASGRYHVRQAMTHVFDLADQNKDEHLTVAELASVREQLSSMDAHHHFAEWAQHHEL